jgi:DNA-directed RNA polymerase specialized sigma24 family protein
MVTPSQKLLRAEQLLLPTHALATLPDDQRAAYDLHHFQGPEPEAIEPKSGRN